MASAVQLAPRPRGAQWLLGSKALAIHRTRWFPTNQRRRSHVPRKFGRYEKKHVFFLKIDGYISIHVMIWYSIAGFLPQTPAGSLELQTVAAKSKPSPGKFQTYEGELSESGRCPLQLTSRMSFGWGPYSCLERYRSYMYLVESKYFTRLHAIYLFPHVL